MGQYATKMSILKVHIKPLHENITYPCDQCDYKANLKHHLKKYIESRHGNVTYSCDQCEYKLIQRSNLKQHIESRHGNLTYPCEKCVCLFKTTFEKAHTI